MTIDEARAIVAAHNQENALPKPQHPDAPDCGDLSPKARETAAELFGKAALETNAGQLSAAEKDFLRQGIAAWQEENK